MTDLIGKTYTFDDGSELSVLQIKSKEIDNETVQLVTYTQRQGPSLPRKFVLPLETFLTQFGHLFDVKS